MIKKISLSDNAMIVLSKRYLKKNEKGKIVESPEEMFYRVAENIAQADKLYDDANIEKTVKEFYDIMSNLEFLPNSPTLMNAGKRLQQLSGCFVIPIEDSMESIFQAIKDAALVHQSGGGTGFSFSNLRSKGSVVSTTNGRSSGPVSFMKVFNSATNVIKQGGTRRGANSALLRVDHPDILEFIKCKNDNNDLNNFNISVALTDDFMNFVIKDKDYELINSHTKKITERLSAKKVFDMIVKSAWKNGEPGIVFINEINQYNPTPNIGIIEANNPCNEQPLLSYESCNLGSINVSKFVKDKRIDFDKLKIVIHHAVHFLDNVIDMNKYPLKEIESMTKGNRKIGLGIMGFADMLILMDISYGSDEALIIANDLMKFISKEADVASIDLAKKRGSFPNFADSLLISSFECIRNATRTTIAPTGSISIIANCSSGIEPLFAVSYVKKVMDDDKLIEVNSIFKSIMKNRGYYSDDLMERISKVGTIKNIEPVPNDIKKLFVTALDISYSQHIKIQSVFQKYTNNGVSKTINMSYDATIEDVKNAYLLAYKKKCKGVTVYRDGSRDNQTLNINLDGKKDKGEKVISKYRLRPDVIKGFTEKIVTGCGNLYVTINEDDNLVFEIFTQMGKGGGCPSSQLEAIGRLVSLAFRSNINPNIVVKQLRGISCHKPIWCNGKHIKSCSDAISKVIERYMNVKGNVNYDLVNIKKGYMCPDCNNDSMEISEGCVKCLICGYSKCE